MHRPEKKHGTPAFQPHTDHIKISCGSHLAYGLQVSHPCARLVSS